MFHVEQIFISKFQFNPYFSTEFLNNVHILQYRHYLRLREDFFFLEEEVGFLGLALGAG